MKKVVFTILSCLTTSFGIAQNTDFLKRVENKYSVSQFTRQIDTTTGKEKIKGEDNISGKGVIEKLLFGEKNNGNIEFFVSPSFEGAFGLRIIKDSTDTSFLLETTRIGNFKEAWEEVDKKYPTVGIPIELITSLPDDIVNLTGEHNKAMLSLHRKEVLKLYKIESCSAPISDRFAEMLHAKFVSLIGNFKANELQPGLRGDGETTIFRSIVDQELWTLAIPFRTEEEALELSDLCKQMIADVEAGTFDETKYIKLLKD